MPNPLSNINLQDHKGLGGISLSVLRDLHVKAVQLISANRNRINWLTTEVSSLTSSVRNNSQIVTNLTEAGIPDDIRALQERIAYLEKPVLHRIGISVTERWQNSSIEVKVMSTAGIAIVLFVVVWKRESILRRCRELGATVLRYCTGLQVQTPEQLQQVVEARTGNRFVEREQLQAQLGAFVDGRAQAVVGRQENLGDIRNQLGGLGDRFITQADLQGAIDHRVRQILSERVFGDLFEQLNQLRAGIEAEVQRMHQHNLAQLQQGDDEDLHRGGGDIGVQPGQQPTPEGQLAEWQRAQLQRIHEVEARIQAEMASRLAALEQEYLNRPPADDQEHDDEPTEAPLQEQMQPVVQLPPNEQVGNQQDRMDALAAIAEEDAEKREG